MIMYLIPAWVVDNHHLISLLLLRNKNQLTRWVLCRALHGSHFACLLWKGHVSTDKKVSIWVGFDWSGGIEQLRILQVVPGFHSGGHETSILASSHRFFNTFLHRPAKPRHVVLVHQPRVGGDKLGEQFGILIIRLGSATRSKSPGAEYASGRCRTVRILHRDWHVGFWRRLDGQLKLRFSLTPLVFWVGCPCQWRGHHHRWLLPPRSLDKMLSFSQSVCLFYLFHGFSFELRNIADTLSNPPLVWSRDTKWRHGHWWRGKRGGEKGKC